jgi:hypothetical protein
MPATQTLVATPNSAPPLGTAEGLPDAPLAIITFDMLPPEEKVERLLQLQFGTDQGADDERDDDRSYVEGQDGLDPEERARALHESGEYPYDKDGRLKVSSPGLYGQLLRAYCGDSNEDYGD